MNNPLANTVAMQMTQEVKADPITERVIACVAEMMGLNESAVKPEANISDDLGADSLDRVEILMSIEFEFGIDIADHDAEQIHTVQQAIDLVKTKID